MLAVACAAFAAEVAAHAELVASTPADAAALAAAPARIELVFNEPVRVLSVDLADASGNALRLGASSVEGNAVRAPIEAKLADGHYVVRYSVASLDSHPVNGAIAFRVGAGPPPRPAATRFELQPLHVAVRALRDFALLLAAGAALFALAVGGFPRERMLLRAAAGAGIVCALAAFALQGTGLHSSFALSACVACIGLAGIGAGTFAMRKVLLGAGAVVALASLPLTGHAVGRPLAMAALAGHGLAAAFWLGSLAALLNLLSAPALRRFSAIGVPAVALLLACGVTLAAMHIGSLQDLWQADYGRLVLAKALLLSLLIVIALGNRYRLLPALERGDGRALHALRRTVAFELGLLAVVVLLTAALVQTPPRGAAREQVLESAGRTATVSIAPRVITVRLRDARGAPLDAAEVQLELGPQRVLRSAERVAAGLHRYEGETYGAEAGLVVVHARIGEFEKISWR